MGKRLKNGLSFLLVVAIVMTLLLSFTTSAFAVTAPPAWAKNLVIYELNPRGFTSPNGSGDGNGSGTFASLTDKMQYLQDLGITGIWLAGFSKATNHFYNLWSVYACERPDVLDPVLGTSADFQNMINAAHSKGIKVFLDVISHGVLNESDLITQHPTWFSGGSWNMTDYNYNNTGFQNWWISVWTNYVTTYGVDGYRVDLNLYKPSLWDTITQNCANAGHPILVFPEGAISPYNERYHFCQHDYSGFAIWPGTDFAGTANQYYGEQISCHDQGYGAAAGNYYQVKGDRRNFGYSGVFEPNIPIFFSGEEWNADQVQLPNCQKNLYGGGGPGGWLYGSWLQWNQQNDADHAAMLNDVKKMLAIKKNNSDVLTSDRWTSKICAVGSDLSPWFYPPYARYLEGTKAIIIVGNSAGTSNYTLKLKIPLTTMKMNGKSSYKVTDLWGSQGVRTMTEAQLASLSVTMLPNTSPGGGIAVLKIEPQ